MSSGTIKLPAARVVYITQQFYCPLFMRPIDWLLQRASSPDAEVHGDGSREVHHVVKLLDELRFKAEGASDSPNNAYYVNSSELFVEKEDWYAELSGGQRVKAELVARLFRHSECPAVLLLDESFAPLDPLSRQLVMTKIKSFCRKSVVLVIYHSDDNSGCVSGGFFDENLHFANGTSKLVGLCA